MIGMFRSAALLILSLFVLMAPGAAWAQQGQLRGGSLLLGAQTRAAAEEFVAQVNLTNAQVLALHTTPVTIVAAPGAGKIIEVLGVVVSFDYTGAYTGGSAMRLWYGSRVAGSAASASMTASGLLVSVSADVTRRFAGTPDDTDVSVNAAVVAQLAGAAFGGGNAANAVRIQVKYRVVFVP